MLSRLGAGIALLFVPLEGIAGKAKVSSHTGTGSYLIRWDSHAGYGTLFDPNADSKVNRMPKQRVWLGFSETARNDERYFAKPPNSVITHHFEQFAYLFMGDLQVHYPTSSSAIVYWALGDSSSCCEGSAHHETCLISCPVAVLGVLSILCQPLNATAERRVGTEVPKIVALETGLRNTPSQRNRTSAVP